MPRKPRRAKRRSFDAASNDVAWLTGDPCYDDFDYLYGGLSELDVAIERGLYRDGAYRPMAPSDVKTLEVGEGAIYRTLQRLKKLHDNLPAHLRDRVPKDRAALLKAIEV